MAIRFLPNDPLAGPDAPPLRRQSPLPNRPASRAGFTLHDPEPEGLYDPGSPGFLFWQCREAALLTLATWERHAPVLHEWQGRRAEAPPLPERRRPVGRASGAERLLRPHRASCSSRRRSEDARRYSGASTDVVAHEIGHGLLDAMRPDLWDTPFLEVNAFHEAFGDCIALLTALHDPRTRTAVLRVGLGRRNFVETFGEDLADAIRREQPGHNAAVPRQGPEHACSGSSPRPCPRRAAPGSSSPKATASPASSPAASGTCVRNLAGRGDLERGPAAGGASRRERCWCAAPRWPPRTARFFRAVGRAMALADEEETGGDAPRRDPRRLLRARHRPGQPRDAGAHGRPRGSRPDPRRRGAPALAATTRRDLKGRLGASAKARMVLKRRAIGGARVVQAMHLREVPLGNVSELLRGVVALAPEGVLVGRSGHHAALLGALPEASATTDEVEAYVASLVAHDRIDYGTGRGGRGAAPRAGSRGRRGTAMPSAPRPDAACSPASGSPVSSDHSRGRVIVRVNDPFWSQRQRQATASTGPTARQQDKAGGSSGSIPARLWRSTRSDYS